MKIFKALPAALPFFCLVAGSTCAQTRNSTAIALDYANHTISFTNTTANGHNINVYKNIRFAQPPTGQSRFLKPVTPPPNATGVQDGHYDFEIRCVSAVPEGADIIYPGLGGTTFGSEDCLFLDVYVPDDVSSTDSVPVLHQIYGSAYAFGSKEFAFTPLGLFDVMLGQGQPFILVASNYRMGLYGWFASPYENMDANNGVWDALTALEWTQQYIKRFGGDPLRVTSMGQSSGSAILELLALSPRLADSLPFQQVYQTVLNATNCTDIECLQTIDESSLAEANRYLLNEVPSSSGGGNQGPGIGFGPVVDGFLVPDLTVANPNLTRAARGLKGLITGNMQNEGEIVSSDENMPEAFPDLVRRIIPSASNETVNEIQSSYTYPPGEPEQLAWQWTTDAIFECHNIALTSAIPRRARRYIMSIPPAWHGGDVNYYFFTDNTTTPVADPQIAKSFQSMLGNFIYGNEEALDQDWPMYGNGSGNTVLNITATGFEVGMSDSAQVQRCNLINSVFMDAENGV